MPNKKSQKLNENPNLDQSRRFEEACELMRRNAAKFANNEATYESSSSEDELNESEIVNKTLLQYPDGDNQGLLKIREYLLEVLTSGALVCLICIETIKRNDSVWSCQHCYCILHLACIQKWAKDSVFSKSTINNNDQKWCCPKCRAEYIFSNDLLKYLCFCGKEENPGFDPWRVPHSCSKICDKRLKPECSHSCSLLCHPGPCPPCPQTVSISCCCSKSNSISRRCSNKEWSCGKPCNKQLTCKLHLCESVCHIGSCPPCTKTSKNKCLCGRTICVVSCNNPVWQCDKVCSKPLKCKNHFCEIKCHEGPCPDCPGSLPRPCPCTKTIYNLKCSEPVYPCGDTCNKLLECELHRCSRRCHFGPCGECLEITTKSCRCGQRQKNEPCSKEFICDIKCKSHRDCGKHFCHKKCCTGNCPPCEVPCGKTLNCGRHKCSSICHPGPCFPCRETVTITCNCGISKNVIPCGRKKNVVPPKCSAYCQIPSDCHHSKRHPHHCHPGACPPCKLICGKLLPCKHVCPAKCHSAVLKKCETNQKITGPWDLINSSRVVRVDKPCPPCQERVLVQCFGTHEDLPFPCHEARVTSCGRPCGRKLLCQNHNCEFECHMQKDECQSCEEMCSNKLGCGHSCRKRCHPGNCDPQPCKQKCNKQLSCGHVCPHKCHPGDCSPCQEILLTKCYCEFNEVYNVCSMLTSSDGKKKQDMLSCHTKCTKLRSCGHPCNKLCHAGECEAQSPCTLKINLKCACGAKKMEIICPAKESPNKLCCDDECIKENLHKYEELLKIKESGSIKERKKAEKELEELKKKIKDQQEKMKKCENDTQGKYEIFDVTRILGVIFLVSSITAYLIFNYM